MKNWLLTLGLLAGLCSWGRAEPISGEDVIKERGAICPAAAAEKVQVIRMAQASRSPYLVRAAQTGVSLIDNKLAAVDVEPVVPPRNLSTKLLDTQQKAYHLSVTTTNYAVHYPANGKACYLDLRKEKHPELFLDSAALAAGVNVLVPLETIQAPSCLSGDELEDYVRLHFDLGLKPGDYWRLLHRTLLTDEQLAHLRYYEYLENNAPKQPVSVYRCYELTLRNR